MPKVSPDLEKAVTFALLMGANISGKSPEYILEKWKAAHADYLNTPALLDAPKMASYERWLHLWLEDRA